MKRNIFATILLISTITGALFAQVRKDNLAVLPFTGGLRDEGETIAELLSFDKQLSAKFGIIPRTSISNAIDKEHGFQMTSGMTNADTIAALGKQLGAKYVMAGTITALGSQKLLVVTIVRIETIQLVAGDFLTYTEIEELPTKFSNIMKTLLPLLDVNTSVLQKLAVLPIQMQGGATNQRDADTLAHILAIHLLRNKSFAIYPRTSSVEKVQEEFRTQLSGVTADENAAQLGYGVNPEYVLSVVSRKLGTSNMFNAIIIDIADGIQVDGMSENYGTLTDGIAAMESIARTLSGGKMSESEIKQREKGEAARKTEEERAEAAWIAAVKRAEAERIATNKRDEFLRKSMYHVSAYFDLSFIDVFAQNSELELNYQEKTSTDKEGEEHTSNNSYQNWLYSGKVGMEFDLRNVSIGAYFAWATYKADYIRKGVASDTGTVGGLGLGGDFYLMYLWGGGLSRIGIGPGVTLLNFTENPLDVPSLFPYLQLRFSVHNSLYFGMKLEFPVVNGEVTAPAFGLNTGLGFAWPMKR